jgi:hypothetical protein
MKTIDACSLLTPAELAATVGGPEPVGEQLPAGGWVAGQCAWKSPVANFLISVGTASSITAFGDPTVPDAQARFGQYKQRLTAQGTAKDVDGIGDGAVLGATGIAAYSGGTYVEILRLRLTDKQLIDIARLAVGKL